MAKAKRTASGDDEYYPVIQPKDPPDTEDEYSLVIKPSEREAVMDYVEANPWASPKKRGRPKGRKSTKRKSTKRKTHHARKPARRKAAAPKKVRRPHKQVLKSIKSHLKRAKKLIPKL